MFLILRLRRLKRISVHGCLITRSDWLVTVFEKSEPYVAYLSKLILNRLIITIETLDQAIISKVGRVIINLIIQSSALNPLNNHDLPKKNT